MQNNNNKPLYKGCCAFVVYAIHLFLCRKAKYLETCNTNNKLDFADVVEITTLWSCLSI